jgi:hypothetical protein
MSVETDEHVNETVVAVGKSLLKLDFGCGPNPKEGFEGVDQYPFGGKVKHILNICCTPWPFEDNSVEEANVSHFLEHLAVQERIRFLNELHRVMVDDAKVTVITPHWCSNRAYGDPTHQWPPVSEMMFCYLSRKWRLEHAPHTDRETWSGGYSCDFDWTYGYSFRSDLATRSAEYQQFAFANYKEVVLDIVGTLTCRKGR